MVSNHQKRKTLNGCYPKNVKTEGGKKKRVASQEKMT